MTWEKKRNLNLLYNIPCLCTLGFISTVLFTWLELLGKASISRHSACWASSWVSKSFTSSWTCQDFDKKKSQKWKLPPRLLARCNQPSPLGLPPGEKQINSVLFLINSSHVPQESHRRRYWWELVSRSRWWSSKGLLCRLWWWLCWVYQFNHIKTEIWLERRKLMICRAVSGITQPSSSSPLGHWTIWSHLIISTVGALVVVTV